MRSVLTRERTTFSVRRSWMGVASHLGATFGTSETMNTADQANSTNPTNRRLGAQRAPGTH